VYSDGEQTRLASEASERHLEQSNVCAGFENKVATIKASVNRRCCRSAIA
jgi:hypothetical protein